jgi:hypothetical protein
VLAFLMFCVIAGPDGRAFARVTHLMELIPRMASFQALVEPGRTPEEVLPLGNPMISDPGKPQPGLPQEPTTNPASWTAVSLTTSGHNGSPDLQGAHQPIAPSASLHRNPEQQPLPFSLAKACSHMQRQSRDQPRQG